MHIYKYYIFGKYKVLIRKNKYLQLDMIYNCKYEHSHSGNEHTNVVNLGKSIYDLVPP